MKDASEDCVQSRIAALADVDDLDLLESDDLADSAVRQCLESIASNPRGSALRRTKAQQLLAAAASTTTA